MLDDPWRPPFRAAVASATVLEEAEQGTGAPEAYWRLSGEMGLIVASWGYALTVHKAQGSGWDDVCVVEEDHDDPRWLYTAVTRAAQRLTHLVHDAHPVRWNGRVGRGWRSRGGPSWACASVSARGTR